jgi:ABC-type uncharacterized transport system substrate-binding protein
VLVVFLLCQSSAQATSLRIVVVLSAGKSVYQEFAEAFRASVSSQHEVQIVVLGEAYEPVDLVIAVGMKATAQMSSSPTAVLSVLVPRAEIDGISQESSKQRSAIFLDQPLDRQFALLSATLPSSKHIAIVYSESSKYIASIIKLASEKQYFLHEGLVEDPNKLGGILVEVLGESEILLVTPDAEVYRPDTIRNILLETYRRRIPVVAISRSYVRAGALCAVYSTPEQIAKQAAGMIAQFARTSKLPDNQYPQEFEVAVNTQVARSLGLTIKSAEQLRTEIGGKP